MVGSLDGLTSTNTSSTTGSDEANLLARGAVTGDGRGVTNVLMVTSSMRMLNGVTGNTTNLGPAVALATEAVVAVTGLEDRLLDTASSSNDTDHSTAGGADRLLLARGELEAGAAGLEVVGDDGAVVSGGTGNGSTVTGLGLDVADDASLDDVSEGEDVTDGKGGLLSADDVLSSEHTLRGDEELTVALVLVGATELNTGKGGTTAGLVLDGLDDTAHESVTLGVVTDAELGGSEALVAVDLVDGSGSLTLGEDDLSHSVVFFGTHSV